MKPTDFFFFFFYKENGRKNERNSLGLMWEPFQMNCSSHSLSSYTGDINGEHIHVFSHLIPNTSNISQEPPCRKSNTCILFPHEKKNKH